MMNQAKTILLHAIEMIFLNFGATCRVLAPALALIIGATLLAPMAAFEQFDPYTATPENAVMPGNMGAALLGLLVTLVGYLLLAILWHRYVLLPDDQRARGVMPSGRIVLRYLGYSLVLGLIIATMGFVVMMPVGILAAASQVNSVGMTVLMLPAFMLLCWAGLRLSLVLPAVAMDGRLGFAQSWTATKPMSQVILWLALGLAVLNVVFGFVTGAVTGTLGMLLNLVGSIVLALIGTSVLTTLYGILIEGRRL